MCKLDTGCKKECVEVYKTLFPKTLPSAVGDHCVTPHQGACEHMKGRPAFVCWSNALIVIIKKGSFSSHLSFTMQVCKNQSADFRYLFRHVSLHGEATWPRCIQPFAVPATSLSITSQGRWLLKVLAAPGGGCLCGPSWEHQIYE